MIALSLNGTIDIIELRVLNVRRGAWVVEADLDLGTDTTLPSGAAQVQIANAATGKAETLQGTIVDEGTGRLGEKATVRIAGGKGGWPLPAPAQHFKNDAGVTVADVLNATASAVGETVANAPTDALGPDYVRTDGPAARVLVGLDWYIDSSGTTQIGARGPSDPPEGVEVLHWDPLRRTIELAADGLVWPGTTITEDRCGTVVLRDIEQTFSRRGSRVIASCTRSVAGELAAMFRTLIEEFGGVQFLKTYRYRIVQQQTGPAGTTRLHLQAVRPAAGVPDTLPVDVWPGEAGFDAQYPLGTLCIVQFDEGDPTLPRISAFQAPTAADAGYIARADKTDGALAALRTAFNEHVHVTPSGNSNAPTAVVDQIPVPDPGSTASKIGKVA
jgi:hypothetical protein